MVREVSWVIWRAANSLCRIRFPGAPPVSFDGVVNQLVTMTACDAV